MRWFFGLLLVLLYSSFTIAQTGGLHVYDFLSLSPTARTTALAGSLLAVKDDDVALAYQNPAVLNSRTHQQLSFNYNFHLADIKNGYFSYGHYLKKWEVNVHGGIAFMDYGKFEETNEFEQNLGSFHPREYALVVGAGKQLYEKLSVGVNIKGITSQLGRYQSLGLGFDIGTYYQDTSSNFAIALVLQNLGWQLTQYSETESRASIPLSLNVGISQKLKYLPFRLTVQYNELNRWNILYDDPNQVEENPILGDEGPKGQSGFSKNLNNFFGHLTFGGEFLLGKRENFRIRIGYNHARREELKVGNFRSLTGFSFGAGVKISKFRVEFGRATYHLAGSIHHLSISTNLGSFKK